MGSDSVFTLDQIENMRKLWGDDLFTGINSDFEPGKKRHTVTCSVGEPVFGPMFWRYHKPIPWLNILRADSLGSGYRHLRVYLLVRGMFDAFRCSRARPLAICRRDSDYVRVNHDDFNRTLNELSAAGLIEAYAHHGRKTRVYSSKHTAGKYRTCREMWFPPISHISTHLPGVAVLAYAYLSMFLVNNESRAILPKNLPGWVKSRREFRKGTTALVAAGIIGRESCREYTLPVLFGPHPDVEIQLGTIPSKREYTDES